MKKSWKFQGVGGSHVKPSGTENPGGWGLKLEKTLCGGYGYFLEPHIPRLVHVKNYKEYWHAMIFSVCQGVTRILKFLSEIKEIRSVIGPV